MISYGRPERKDVTERIERLKKEQAERDELNRQARTKPTLAEKFAKEQSAHSS
jgi:hypothetical protein